MLKLNHYCEGDDSIYKIFISHSSKDKVIIDTIADELLILGIGFIDSEIFCTSIEGMGIKTSEDWRIRIKDSLLESEIILLVLTPNYKESEICLNEMGAAWATHDKVIPIIVPPVTFSSIGITFDVKQAIDLTNETGLDDFRDCLLNWTGKPPLASARWSAKKKEALVVINDFISTNPFPTPLSRDMLTALENELSETRLAHKGLALEKRQLKELNEHLMNAKDKVDVTKIKRDVGMLSDYDVFEEKAKSLRESLKKVDSFISTIIFNESTYNELRYTRGNAFRIAVAEGLIDDEGNLITNHPKIKRILTDLTNIKNFFDKDMSNEAIEMLEAEYPDISLDFSNLSFWVSILGVSIDYIR